jgi:hypothetical protein
VDFPGGWWQPSKHGGIVFDFIRNFSNNYIVNIFGTVFRHSIELVLNIESG